MTKEMAIRKGFARSKGFFCFALILILLFMTCIAPAVAEVPVLGDKGELVDQMKERLYRLKYFNSSKYGKSYNEATAEKISDFQRMNGIAPTGVMDEYTWDVLFSDEARSAWRAPVITDATHDLYQWPTLPEDMPENLDGNGFLPAGSEPYVFAGREEGFWCYISEDIHIEIRRIEEDHTPLVWYETDIRLGGTQKLRSLLNPNAKKIRARDPRDIAKEYGAILAFSDDFYGYRIMKGINNAGVIIRDGKILYEKTVKSGGTTVPNLDLIALFQDGSMRTYRSYAHKAKEYLEMGVTDTWAFGPILLRDGQIDERVLESSKAYRDEDPRNAIGMISPGHYVVLTVMGRQKSSLGVRPLWSAQRMKDLGCTEALNLDGGNSIAIVFMGDMINKAAGADINFMKGIRALSSMIGVGFVASDEAEAAP